MTESAIFCTERAVAPCTAASATCNDGGEVREAVSVTIPDCSPCRSELLHIPPSAVPLLRRKRGQEHILSELQHAVRLSPYDPARLRLLSTCAVLAKRERMETVRAMALLMMAETYFHIGREAESTNCLEKLDDYPTSEGGHDEPAGKMTRTTDDGGPSEGKRLWDKVRRMIVPSALRLIENEYNTALVHAERALETFVKASPVMDAEEQAARLLLVEGNAAVGMVHRAVAHATHYLARCNMLGRGVGKALLVLAKAQLQARNYTEAVETYTRGVEHFHSKGETLLAVAAKGGLGTALRGAQESYAAIMTAYTLHTEQLNYMLRGEAGGRTLRTRHLSEGEAEHLERFVGVATAHTPTGDLGGVCFEMGRDLFLLGRPTEAKRCFLEAVGRWERKDNRRGHAKDIMRGLSWAVRCIEGGSEVLSLPNLPDDIPRVMTTTRDDEEEALQLLAKHHQLVYEIGMREEAASILLRRSRFEEAVGNRAAAVSLAQQCIDAWTVLISSQQWQGMSDIPACQHDPYNPRHTSWGHRVWVDLHGATRTLARCHLQDGEVEKAFQALDHVRNLPLSSVIVRKADNLGKVAKAAALKRVEIPEPFDANEMAIEHNCIFLVFAFLHHIPRNTPDRPISESLTVEVLDYEHCDVWVIAGQGSITHQRIPLFRARDLVSQLPFLQPSELVDALSELFNILIAPFDHILSSLIYTEGSPQAGSELLVVVPDGFLWGVPWGALFDPSSPPFYTGGPPGRHIIQAYTVVAIHSVRTFHITSVLNQRFTPPEPEITGDDEDEVTKDPTFFYCGNGSSSVPLVVAGTSQAEGRVVSRIIKGGVLLSGREVRRAECVQQLTYHIPPAAIHMAIPGCLRHLHNGASMWRGALRYDHVHPIQQLTAQDIAGLRLLTTPMVFLTRTSMWWQGGCSAPRTTSHRPPQLRDPRRVVCHEAVALVASTVAVVMAVSPVMIPSDPCDSPPSHVELGRCLSWEVVGDFEAVQEGVWRTGAAESPTALPGVDLVTAFFAAEVPCVLATLWRDADDSGRAQRIMAPFWSTLVDHRGKQHPRDNDVPRDEALRGAVLQAIRQHVCPSVWAPLQLFGYP